MPALAARVRETDVLQKAAPCDASHERTQPPFSTRDLRDAFGTFATGVTVVTGVRPDGEPVGVTANSFTSVSLDPPLLSWCLARTSSSVSAFTIGSPFAVHILAEDQRDLAMHFARRAREKFDADHNWRANPTPPEIADVLCRFDCRVRSVYPEGDHLIVIGEIIGIKRRAGVPLVFHGGRFGSFRAEVGSPGVDMEEVLRSAWF